YTHLRANETPELMSFGVLCWHNRGGGGGGGGRGGGGGGGAGGGGAGGWGGCVGFTDLGAHETSV
ncbi:hypothetical protein ACVGWQ_02755, partial [Enterobacter hormaechei]